LRVCHVVLGIQQADNCLLEIVGGVLLGLNSSGPMYRSPNNASMLLLDSLDVSLDLIMAECNSFLENKFASVTCDLIILRVKCNTPKDRKASGNGRKKALQNIKRDIPCLFNRVPIHSCLLLYETSMLERSLDFVNVTILQSDAFLGIFLTINFGAEAESLKKAFEPCAKVSVNTLACHNFVNLSPIEPVEASADFHKQNYERIAFISQLLTSDPIRLVLLATQISKLDEQKFPKEHYKFCLYKRKWDEPINRAGTLKLKDLVKQLNGNPNWTCVEDIDHSFMLRMLEHMKIRCPRCVKTIGFDSCDTNPYEMIKCLRFTAPFCEARSIKNRFLSLNHTSFRPVDTVVENESGENKQKISRK